MHPRTQIRVVSIEQGGEGQGHDLTDDIEGLSWSSVNPGGDERCTFTLKRSWFSANPEIERGNLLRVMCGIDVLWQGRVEETNRSADSTEKIAVTAYGLGARLKDGTFQEIFIDGDFSGWGEPSTQRRLNQVGAGLSFSPQVSIGAQDAGATEPGLLIDFTSTETVASRAMGAEIWYYGGGVSIGKLRYSFLVLSGPEGNATWQDQAFVLNDDIASAFNSGTDHNATDSTNRTLTATTATRKYALVASNYTDGGGTDMTDLHGWIVPKVIGRHELTEQGTWPNIGFTVDQMVRYLVELVPGISIRRIDEQSFVVQQAAYKEPQPHEDGISDLNRFEGCDWGTWGPDSPLDTSIEGQFDFKDREPETQHWFVPRRDCEDLDLHSETSTLYGAVDVTFEDETGVRRTIRREVDVPDLDGAGITRVYPLDIGKSRQDVAEQMGDAFLAIWGQFAPARGGFSTSAPVRHHERGELSPVYLRADGSNVRLGGILPSTSALTLDSSPDRRTTFPIKRVEVDCSGEVPAARVDVDQANDTLSILQARQGLESELVAA